MKRICIATLICVALGSCHSGTKTGNTGADSSAPSASPDKIALQNDSARQSLDSMVNASPDTLKAK